MHCTVGKIVIMVAMQYRMSNVFFCLNTGSMGLNLTWGKRCVSTYFQCLCCTVLDKSHVQEVYHTSIKQDYKLRKQEVLDPLTLYKKDKELLTGLHYVTFSLCVICSMSVFIPELK